MTDTAFHCSETCFFEHDASVAIYHRAAAEAAGTLMLMFVACGAGLVIKHMPPDGSLVGHLSGALMTAANLSGLILTFDGASSGDFNPLITMTQWLNGERNSNCSIAYVLAQFAGALVAAGLANALLGEGAEFSPAPAVNPTLVFSELFASTTLMLVVVGCSRSGRSETGPLAVAAWLAALIFVTPSGASFPAITFTALFTLGPTHIWEPLAACHVLAQIVGALLAAAVIVIVIVIIYPQRRTGLKNAQLGKAA